MLGWATHDRPCTGWASVGVFAMRLRLCPKSVALSMKKTWCQYTAHLMTDAPFSDCPPTLDGVASARWSAWPHAQSPWLHEEIGQRMQERLEWIRLQPKLWVDWSPLDGGLTTHAKVRARYPDSRCLVVEPTLARAQLTQQLLQAPWWQRWLKPQALSFGNPALGSADMVWANMALHVSAHPQALLQQWHQALAVDGFVMFSCLGPDTLHELHAVYQQQGWPAPSHAFTDMHDWGDMLVAAGFAEPVMDMERLTLTYASPQALLTELRGLGRNLSVARFAGLRGRHWQMQLEEALLALAKPDLGGRLSVTVEVIYGHALKPLPRAKMAEQSSVSLQDMRTMLGQSKG